MPIQNHSPAARTRRRLLRAGLLATTAGLAAALPAARAGSAAASLEAPRLALLNSHTGERLDVVFREGTRYLDDALAAIDWVLRDHRTGQTKPTDPALLETLAGLGNALDTTESFVVISGYRSPATNAKLAAARKGVARNSLHLEARAIDIRVPGRDLETVRRAAIALNAGGVGFYRRSDFVHLDTGRVRTW